MIVFDAIRDIWRGYNADDLVSAKARFAKARQGEAKHLTRREWNALLANSCKLGESWDGTRIITDQYVFDIACGMAWLGPRCTCT